MCMRKDARPKIHSSAAVHNKVAWRGESSSPFYGHLHANLGPPRSPKTTFGGQKRGTAEKSWKLVGKKSAKKRKICKFLAYKNVALAISGHRTSFGGHKNAEFSRKQKLALNKFAFRNYGHKKKWNYANLGSRKLGKSGERPGTTIRVHSL